MVRESARKIPIVCEADVVVVGGSTGAVSAAVAAANAGAKVFLAAPRTYLGEDMCAHVRLWLADGEVPASPLAKAVFAEPTHAALFRDALPFTYRADRPSAAGPSRILSRAWAEAFDRLSRVRASICCFFSSTSTWTSCDFLRSSIAFSASQKSCSLSRRSTSSLIFLVSASVFASVSFLLRPA